MDSIVHCLRTKSYIAESILLLYSLLPLREQTDNKRLYPFNAPFWTPNLNKRPITLTVTSLVTFL